MWDPATYLRFGTERARPFFDLLTRVRADDPRFVVDLGCGPGNLTALLAARWPEAQVLGVDNSPQMIEAARAEAGAGLPRRPGSRSPWRTCGTGGPRARWTCSPATRCCSGFPVTSPC